MQVRYVEDLASHDDPESCVRGREALREALTGEHAGGAMSREKFPSGAPTLWRKAEGNMGWRVTASATSALRGLETSCTPNPLRAFFNDLQTTPIVVDVDWRIMSLLSWEDADRRALGAHPRARYSRESRCAAR
jgi:hypothetical protein